MQEELLGIWRQTRKTVVFVTHDVAEAVYLADTISVMSARPGRITQTVPAGFNRDVDPGVWEIAGHVSPNPGGVGPLTRAFLLTNVVELAEGQ